MQRWGLTTPKSLYNPGHENPSFQTESFRQQPSRSGRTIESYPVERSYFARQRRSYDVVHEERATEKRKKGHCSTPDQSTRYAPKRMLLFPQSQSECLPYQAWKSEPHVHEIENCPPPPPAPLEFIRKDPLQENPNLLNQSFPGRNISFPRSYVTSPNASFITGGNSSFQQQMHEASSPRKQQHISKNLQRIEREMGEAFIKMRHGRQQQQPAPLQVLQSYTRVPTENTIYRTNPPAHHRVLSSTDSLTSDQPSTTKVTQVSVLDRNQGGAGALQEMAKRLGELENRNEEYLSLLSQLSQKVLGRKQEGGSAGGVLVGELLAQMNNAEGERQALNFTIEKKDENIAQLSQETMELKRELENVEKQAQSKDQSQQKLIRNQQEELARKEAVISSIQAKACLLEDTDAVLTSIIQRLDSRYENISHNSTLTKAKYIERYLFESKPMQQQARSISHQAFGKIRESEEQKWRSCCDDDERIRDKSEIDLIKREIEMKQMMANTKKLLIDNIPQMKQRNSNTNTCLDRSYDSILYKLGSLEKQMGSEVVKRRNSRTAGRSPVQTASTTTLMTAKSGRAGVQKVKNNNGLNRSMMVAKSSGVRKGRKLAATSVIRKPEGASKLGKTRAKSGLKRNA